MNKVVLASICAISMIGPTVVIAGSPTRPAAWMAKVDPWILDTGRSGETEFLVLLCEQADLSAAATLSTKLEKGRFVFEQLTATAKRTQPPVLAALSVRGVKHRSYWVANMIWVKGDLETVRAMAERADVAHLYANPAVHLDEPVRQGGGDP
jgi:hypothetical protein